MKNKIEPEDIHLIIDGKKIEHKGHLSADVISALNTAEVGEVIKTDEQLFQEWLDSRSGFITGSNFGKLDVLPKLKAEKEAGELGQTAKSYLNTIIAEKYGAPRKELDIYQFKHGKKYEPIAISELEEILGIEFDYKNENQKFFKLNKYTGSTPDGLFSIDFGAEVKCPVDPNKHIEHLKITTQEEFKKKRKDYYWQCVGGMLCTGRNKWIFASFYPYFEGKLRMSILIIERNEDDIAHLSSILQKGKKYMDKTIEELKNIDTSKIIELIKKQVA